MPFMYTLIRLPSKELFAKRIATRLGRPASPEWFVYLALFCAMLYALYPLLIRHAVIASSFSLLSTELIVFAYTLVTTTTLTDAVAAGLWLGLAILTRSMILPVLGLTSVMFVIRGRKGI